MALSWQLRQLSWPELRHHPWRHATAWFAVVLGVALAFSVHLINRSALGEFSAAVRSVNGQPDFELRGQRAGFDEALYGRVAMHPQVALASPVIELETNAYGLDGTRVPLRVLGIDPLVHDLRFVEDNWESPTLGAWGLGWEVWLNGMEVTQFTYFQQVGGIDCRPVTGEITYGLERLAMYLQGVDSVFDIVWTDGPMGRVTYRDVYHQNEVEQSAYNFEHADPAVLFRNFDEHEAACTRLLEAKLALPAYEQVLKASHAFNLLDARRAISVTERQRYILRVRTLARGVAQAYYDSREALGFPMVRAAAPGAPS